MFSQLVLLLATLLAVQGDPSVRISVVRNNVGSSPAYIAFGYLSKDKHLVMASSDDGETFDSWDVVDADSVDIASNPVAISGYVPDIRAHLIFVFWRTSNGQMQTAIQSNSNATQFQTKTIDTKFPGNSVGHELDSIQVVGLKNRTYVFVRTVSNHSQVYWNSFNGSLNFRREKWSILGDGDDHVIHDISVAVNTFLGRIEAFAVLDTGHLYHTWQDGSESFHGDWDKLGGPFTQVKFNSVPVAYQMGHSNFNGVLVVFARGTDGAMHHIWQSTCDKVNNVWGPCTWSIFHQIGGTVPCDKAITNPFVATHSIHLGIEIFTVGKDGHLHHVWQRERDSSYSDWEDLGRLSNTSAFFSSPALLIDKFGWWEAFALDESSALVRFVEKPLVFELSADEIAYGNNVTVTWHIPKDQATHMDWIGVYPKGAPGHGYVDYSYVGGSQNPLKDPVPHGTLQFRTTLPNGSYEYRYMVNKGYDAVFEAPLVVNSAPNVEEWVALFEGLSVGLGGFNTNISECAYDGEHTVQTFKSAFDAFEDRKIFEGLHLFSEGLSDFRDALIQCNETAIVKPLVRFIEDLVACTEDSCERFLIDIGLELVILYEHIYEIYGDIQGATNSFKIDAYEQGGYCVGRVTNACLTVE